MLWVRWLKGGANGLDRWWRTGAATCPCSASCARQQCPVSEGDDKRDAAAVASAVGMGDKGDFAPMWLALLPCDGVRPEKSPHPCALGCHPRAPAAGSSAMEKAHLPNSHRPNPSLQGFHYPTPPTAPSLSAGLPAHKRCVPREGCLLRGTPPSSPPSSCPKQRRRRAAARPSAWAASDRRDMHAQCTHIERLNATVSRVAFPGIGAFHVHRSLLDV